MKAIIIEKFGGPENLVIQNLPDPEGEHWIVGKCSGDGLAIFGVVNVDQPPLPRFSAVDLGFDAMPGHCRSVFPQRRMKNPVEFRPPRVAAHMDR